MLIEDCIMDFEDLFNSLELMNKYLDDEIEDELFNISQNLYNKFKSLALVNKKLIKNLQDNQKVLIEFLEKNYFSLKNL